MRKLLVIVLISSSLCIICGEKSQLLELKKSIVDHANMLKSWKSTNPNHCSWFGVTCNSHGRVSEINIAGGNYANSASCLENKFSNLALHSFGIVRNKCNMKENGIFLSGKLSNFSIGEFSELRVFSIPFNKIGGELPSGIWGLKNLEVVDVEGNLMSGNLSLLDFRNSKSLKVVNLGFNRFFGGIPDSLSECKGLSFLNVGGNRFRGSVPDFLGNFVKLKVINLSLNRMTGSLRDGFWRNCEVLEHVDFSGNLFNGKFRV